VHRSLAVTAILALGTASSASAQVAVGLRGAANVSSPRVTENGAAPAIPYRSRSGFTASLDLDCGTAGVGDLRSHDLGVVFGGAGTQRRGNAGGRVT